MRDYRDHRYRSADDRLDLYARDYPGASDDAPVLLMMHGLTRNSADFEPLVAGLDAGYRIIVPDQRGRGDSDHDPDPANYRPDIYAADMFALLDGLDIESAGLIGTSMGGLMAMIMSAMQGHRFPVIVLNDIGPTIEQTGLDRIANYVGSAGPVSTWEDAAMRTAGVNGEAFPDYSEEDWMAFARRTYREDGDGNIGHAYDPMIARAFDDDDGGAGEVAPDLMWSLWDGLTKVPTLVVRGALSDLLSEKTVTRMGERHEGPFAAVTVPDRGHAPMLDEPDAITAIRSFLGDHFAV